MKVTRTHLHALLLDSSRTMLVADGDQLSVTSPGQFLADGRGRLLITAADLRDAGVHLTRGDRRFANRLLTEPGCGVRDGNTATRVR